MDRDFNLTKKPVTPLVGVDVFIPDSESRVLLIKRTDNGFWCTPGGSQDLGETPEECGVREVLEDNKKSDNSTCIDRKLITGASPLAANELGKLAANTLLQN